MKYVLRGATAVSILALGMVGTQAADLTYEPAPVVEAPAAFNWTGFYIGVHGGLGSGKFDHAVDLVQLGGPGVLPLATLDVTSSGGFGGAQIGYNYQFSPNWVVGAEADIAFSGIESDINLGISGGEVDLKTSVDWFGTVRGRLGYAWDNVLVYGTGGLAYGDVETSLDLTGTQGFSSSDTLWGWTAGAGVEYGITKNITLKAEYLYVDLGTFDIATAIPVADTAGLSASADVAFHTLKAGLNYKF